MSNQSIEKKKRWLNRLQNTRRYYSFQKWSDKPPGTKISLKKLLEWISEDISYLIRWNINLMLQLKNFGNEVKKYSGLSFFEQWKRMAFLVFKIHKDSTNFRLHHLFDADQWEKAARFCYARQYLIQLKFEGFFPEEEIEIIRNKFEFYQYCKRHSFNTPKVYAIIKNGKIVYPIENSFSFPEQDLFVKDLTGSQGRGVKYFKYKNRKYYDLDESNYSSKELHAYLSQQSKNTKGVIIQQAIKNHSKWKKFTNGSLATCRIVTGRSPYNEGEIIPFFAALRMPVGSADGDNYSLGGIASAIDMETGRLGKAISKTPIDGNFAWDTHPDTGAQITGSNLYLWEELVEFTQSIHKKFETLSIGWDISLAENGLTVIEGNRLWGSDVIEGPSRVPIYETKYPEWTEDWIEKLSAKNQREVQA